jgi:TPR repeat protein
VKIASIVVVTSAIFIGLTVILLVIRGTIVSEKSIETVSPAETVRGASAPIPPADDQFVPDLRARAESGDPDAQWKLGGLYSYGVGVARSDAEALKWYRRAADQGYGNAQVSLGVMYDKGEGVEKDQAEALRWYQKAADQGDPNGQYDLGLSTLRVRVPAKTIRERCCGSAWRHNKGMPTPRMRSEICSYSARASTRTTPRQ